ncbi:alpha/beta hydrolase [Actinomadura viridis]|uniref:alpha/beta hydrolase n=1 Tax=Actinomadura viridis TaxID=58110 RepID=UPI0036B4E686
MSASAVSFDSGSARLRGRLHLPPGRTGPVPCVVLCHGFSGTMDRLVPHAEAFAAAGLAALVFDYRNFGESDGEPRQLVDIDGQQEDVRAAIAFARAREEIDPGRVLLWGNSLGGAHAIVVAADDPRVPAVVAQIPFNGFPRKIEGRSAWATLRLQAAILWDAARGRLGLSPYYIPMVGAPGELAITATPEAERHIRTLGGDGQTLWRNSVAPRAALRMARYRPGDAAERLRAPLLVCIAAEDRETPEETTRALAERARDGELRRYPGTHFGFYNDPAVREAALADQIAFFTRWSTPRTER